MATITLKVDDETKRQAEEVFKAVGLGTSAGLLYIKAYMPVASKVQFSN